MILNFVFSSRCKNNAVIQFKTTEASTSLLDITKCQDDTTTTIKKLQSMSIFTAATSEQWAHKFRAQP